MGGAVIEQNLHFLRQADELLSRLDEGAYAAAPGAGEAARSGVGAHLRHCLDFYLCFLRDLEAGRIDYDRRARDRGLERDPRAARAAIDEIRGRLGWIGPAQLEAELMVRTDVAPLERPEAAWSRSSVARELRFLASHTVHHFALIAPLLCRQGIEPGPEFGVAPSTLAEWAATGRPAR